MSYLDYPSEPIGGGNPYHRCVHCKRSTPEINGELAGHEAWCEYRLKHETTAVDPEPLLEPAFNDLSPSIQAVLLLVGVHADAIKEATRAEWCDYSDFAAAETEAKLAHAILVEHLEKQEAESVVAWRWEQFSMPYPEASDYEWHVEFSDRKPDNTYQIRNLTPLRGPKD